MEYSTAVVRRADGDDPMEASAIAIGGIAEGLRYDLVAIEVAEHAREHAPLTMGHDIEASEGPRRVQRGQRLIKGHQGLLGAGVQGCHGVLIHSQPELGREARHDILAVFDRDNEVVGVGLIEEARGAQDRLEVAAPVAGRVVTVDQRNGWLAQRECDVARLNPAGLVLDGEVNAHARRQAGEKQIVR